MGKNILFVPYYFNIYCLWLKGSQSSWVGGGWYRKRLKQIHVSLPKIDKGFVLLFSIAWDRVLLLFVLMAG